MTAASQPTVLDHLFRHESGKMVAVLTKLFGFERLEIAEDLVQDTFVQAFETWKIKGVPENPQGWLYTVAKNKATDYIRRQQVKRKVDSHLRLAIPVEYSITAHLEKAFYEIQDNQLQLLFGICHPAIPEDAQIALALKTLGGFSIDEISRAFLTNKEVINKRLYRAKEKIRKEDIHLEIPVGESLVNRIDSVLKTIYLLYSEGYHSSSTEVVIRKDLCLEAIRLALLLHSSELPKQKDVSALLALMCFHTSRFESRVNDLGELIPWSQQDKKLWNFELIEKGIKYLQGLDINHLETPYQLEAAIAFLHTMDDHPDKWAGMLALYHRLSKIKGGSLVYLNYAFVLNKVQGPQRALEYLNQITDLDHNYLFHALKGEIQKQTSKPEALEHLRKALTLAPLEAEKKILRTKIQEIEVES